MGEYNPFYVLVADADGICLTKNEIDQKSKMMSKTIFDVHSDHIKFGTDFLTSCIKKFNKETDFIDYCNNTNPVFPQIF